MCVSAYGVSTLLLECLASVQHLRDSDNKRKTTAYLAWRKKGKSNKAEKRVNRRRKKGRIRKLRWFQWEKKVFDRLLKHTKSGIGGGALCSKAMVTSVTRCEGDRV